MSKPWDNEPTPFKDQLVDEDGDFFISQDTVENLERRLRHAEKLLEQTVCMVPYGSCSDFYHNRKDEHNIGEECKPLKRYRKKLELAVYHLEAARQEDGR